MKQIVIISGKGGTGKTVITGAFAALAKRKVLADCDVDAADLHLLLRPAVKQKHEFRSGKTAKIDKRLCKECGQCISVCRFGAVRENFSIDPISCEGCAFCSFICPERAITMKENTSGEWFISETRFGPMVHAKLGIAEETPLGSRRAVWRSCGPYEAPDVGPPAGWLSATGWATSCESRLNMRTVTTTGCPPAKSSSFSVKGIVVSGLNGFG